ncbi:hypothetical protein C5167_049726 [Papaver somniferum]|uniref:Uncharacterized protein n=1 Tax=Papaver somniferum TaxID=3469 RepID=A0A4Y7KN09_PAPSO|nr:hypothetical protein C5167_049726 [Papaver somniferum]
MRTESQALMKKCRNQCGRESCHASVYNKFTAFYPPRENCPAIDPYMQELINSEPYQVLINVVSLLSTYPFPLRPDASGLHIVTQFSFCDFVSCRETPLPT